MRKERDEKGQRREPTDQSPGYGEAGIADALRRGAGDGAARASHPGPHDRTCPPSASGVPVRGCAQAASEGRRRRLSGSRNRLSTLPMSVVHFPHFVATAPHRPRKAPCSTFPISSLRLPHDRGRSTGIGLFDLI